MVEIIVTPGENAIINSLQEFEKINIKPLLVGDIHLLKDNKCAYIIERKAKDDLNASIKDGRYKEQKSRLIESGLPRKNIIYLIEGLKSTEKRVWSAICNSQHRDGFTIFMTRTPIESARYISHLANSLRQFDVNHNSEVNVEIKKKSITINEWFKYSLTLIPRCSLNIAEVIIKEYPTIDELKKANIDKISNLKHGKCNRRIGTKLATDIYETIVNA